MLSLAQKSRKAELDIIINAHIRDFVIVASALAEYRRDRLWQEEYESWEQFCRAKFDKCRSYGYELAAAAEVLGNLSGVPDCPTPTSVAQIRPLAQLEPAQQPEAMVAAVAIAPDRQPTAQHVQKAAAAVKSKPEAFPIGSRATVIDELSPHYGQQVEIVQVQGVIVQGRTAAGQAVPFLANELSNGQPPKPIAPPTPKPAKPNPVELIEVENQVLRARCEALEGQLRGAIDLLSRYPANPLNNSWIAEVRKMIA